jgi:hypothetical protein
VNPTIAMAVQAHSPIDLIVTDPDGNTITPKTAIATDEEYLREIPGELYYSISQRGEDGRPMDSVYSPKLKNGMYTVIAVPEVDAPADATYSLEFTVGDQTIILAQDQTLSTIPEQGYDVAVDTTEETPKVTIVKTFDATADTYIKHGTPNQNQGSEGVLRVRAAGDNRALVQFDLTSIPQNAIIHSASLKLNITNNKDNWGKDGGDIGVHGLTQMWTETGATWHCGVDINTNNHNDKDCNDTEWEMGKPKKPELWPYMEAPTATILIGNGQTGTVEFNVADDVAEVVSNTRQNYGWLIRKVKEGRAGHLEFSSRETGTPPQLVVVYE